MFSSVPTSKWVAQIVMATVLVIAIVDGSFCGFGYLFSRGRVQNGAVVDKPGFVSLGTGALTSRDTLKPIGTRNAGTPDTLSSSPNGSLSSSSGSEAEIAGGLGEKKKQGTKRVTFSDPISTEICLSSEESDLSRDPEHPAQPQFLSSEKMFTINSLNSIPNNVTSLFFRSIVVDTDRRVFPFRIAHLASLNNIEFRQANNLPVAFHLPAGLKYIKIVGAISSIVSKFEHAQNVYLTYHTPVNIEMDMASAEKTEILHMVSSTFSSQCTLRLRPPPNAVFMLVDGMAVKKIKGSMERLQKVNFRNISSVQSLVINRAHSLAAFNMSMMKNEVVRSHHSDTRIEIVFSGTDQKVERISTVASNCVVVVSEPKLIETFSLSYLKQRYSVEILLSGDICQDGDMWGIQINKRSSDGDVISRRILPADLCDSNDPSRHLPVTLALTALIQARIVLTRPIGTA